MYFRMSGRELQRPSLAIGSKRQVEYPCSPNSVPTAMTAAPSQLPRDAVGDVQHDDPPTVTAAPIEELRRSRPA